MGKLSANKKMVAGTIQKLGIAPVSDSKLWDDTYLNFIGSTVLGSSSMQNAFFSSLVNKIGLLYITNKSYKNKLANFKKENMPMGVVVEDIYINFTNPQDYDSTSSLMTDDIQNNIYSVYYVADSYKKYFAKTSFDAFTQAFTNWDEMDKFINKIINQLYSSQQLYEWEKTKQLLGNDFNKSVGTMKKEEFKFYSNTFAQDLTKLLRATALNMANPTAKYNNFSAYAVAENYINGAIEPVLTYTAPENLNLIVRNDCLADIDVDVLSVAFNMDKVSFLGKVHGVDNFGKIESDTGTENGKTYNLMHTYKNKNGDEKNVYDITDYQITENGVTYQIKLMCVICDDAFIHIHDKKEPTISEFFDPSNLMRTTYLHSWQVYGLCPFANALAIYTKSVVE